MQKSRKHKILVATTFTAVVLALGVLIKIAYPFSATNPFEVATSLASSDSETYNLLGYWAMEEGTGETLSDGSGNGYDGSISDAAWTTGASDQSNYALAFDGENDFVSTDLSIDESSSGPGATFSAWILVKDYSKGNEAQGQIISTDEESHDWSILVEGHHFAIFTGKESVSGSEYDFNEWYHVVGVFDPNEGTATLYVNGVEDVSGTISYSNNQNNLYIGDNPSTSSDEYFAGEIDEVSVFSDPISPSDVASLYDAYVNDTSSDVDSDDSDSEDDGTDIVCTDLSWMDGRQSFSDVDSNNFYYLPAEFASYFGIFGGYTDGTLRPENQITRAETTKVILEGFRYEVEESDGTNGGFSDLDPSQWYMSYIYSAYINGIMTGNPDGTMKPANTVNKSELLKMFVVASGVTPNACGAISPYPDVATDSWYCPYAQLSKAYGLLPDSTESSFQANEKMTRGDVVYLFYNYDKQWCSANGY
ncbi:MAG: S-layer homology domain-containing protein [Candidatus Gracilibacteria bacterium]